MTESTGFTDVASKATDDPKNFNEDVSNEDELKPQEDKKVDSEQKTAEEANKKKVEEENKAKKEEKKKAEEEEEPFKYEKGKVAHVTRKEDYLELISTGLAVVDFSAKWCGPCGFIAPVYEELAAIHEDIKLLHVDIDEAKGLEKEMEDISAVPTFLFFQNGKQVHKVEGANKDNLLNGVKNLAATLNKEDKKVAKSKTAGCKCCTIL